MEVVMQGCYIEWKPWCKGITYNLHGSHGVRVVHGSHDVRALHGSHDVRALHTIYMEAMV